MSTVAKKVPVLLILEDIHWIDNNSADLLSMLLHRLRSTNITIICTSRDILQPYAQQVLNNAVRDKLLDVYNIDAFSQEETTRFINFYAPGRYSQKEIDNLYQSTEGNGLFLVQLLDSMHESNGLKNIPASADSIIQMRLAGLSSDELQVLDVISVFRDWAPFDILTSLLIKTPLELLYLCDQLKQKNLLTESTRGKVLGYSFTHERVKAMLSQRQSESCICAPRNIWRRSSAAMVRPTSTISSCSTSPQAATPSKPSSIKYFPLTHLPVCAMSSCRS